MSHEEAVKIDTKLAELSTQLSQVAAKIDSNKLTLARHAGIKPVYVTRTRREVKESASELAAIVAGKVVDGKLAPWDERDAKDALAKREALLGEYAAIRHAMKPLEDLYDEHQWQRFFLVTNQNGHIHASTHCHSCNIRTQFAWLPALSGLTEKDAVDAHGTILCSHCFPSAPVEWTLGIQKEADPNECPGSGSSASAGNRRYCHCLECDALVSVTPRGYLRKHKKAAA